MPTWTTNTRWSVDETKDVERTPSQIEDFIVEAFRKIVPDGAEEAPGTWRGFVPRPLSFYDQCKVGVTLTGVPDEVRSTIAISVVFEASASRIETLVMSTTSIVAIPFGWGWRMQSLRSSKRAAARLLDVFWTTLSPRLEQVVYR